MRTFSRFSILAIATTAVGLTACGDSPNAGQQDLQRDLQLASAATINLAGGQVDSSLLSSMETQPRGVPAAAKVVRKGAGTRAVRSEAPTVEATVDVEPAAVEESGEVQTESDAPVPEPTNEPVAIAPRPTPIVIQAGGAGDYGTGNGGGVFGDAGAGGGRGVVIRGGGVDGDNCEAHRRPRGGVMSSGPQIYIPRPSYPQTGGVSIRPRGVGSVGSGSVASPRAPSSGIPRPSTMRPRGGIR